MSILDDAMDEHMAYLVLSEGRPFSFRDFLWFKTGENEHRMAPKTFRNKILERKKKQEVELAFNSGIAFYTLKGHPFKKSGTPNHTVVSSLQINTNDPLYKMLQSLPFDKRSIHNIRLRLQMPDAWNTLSTSGLPKNKRSKDIVVPPWANEGIIVQARIHHSDVISVALSCSLRPIPLDTGGIIFFFTLLARAEERLRSLLPDQIKVPDYKRWVITMWHFGRDGLIEYTGEKFSRTVEDAGHILTRIYSKEFVIDTNFGKQRRTRIRDETQEYPNISVEAIQGNLVGITYG